MSRLDHHGETCSWAGTAQHSTAQNSIFSKNSHLSMEYVKSETGRIRRGSPTLLAEAAQT